MPAEKQLGREELLRLRPRVYLQDREWVDKSGQPRADLAGNFATAACITFEDAELAPQELLTVYEAIKQCLELAATEDPAVKLQQAVDEAFELSSDLLGKEVNPAIVDWVREWIPFVQDENGTTAFQRHLTSVVQQYSLIIRFKHGSG
jgi:hypothetical protein